MAKAAILVVDDESDLREAIAFDFRRRGFTVFTSSCGRDALKVVESEKIDIVLSDMRMPNGDGAELLEKIKDRNAFLPTVLFITGFSDISHEEAYHLGADAIFAKPFDRQALFEKVESSLEPLEERFQRREPRVELEFPVGLNFQKSGLTVQATILNIGRGGFFVSLNGTTPAVSEEAEFRMETLTTPKLTVSGKGTVRWVRKETEAGLPRGCGIEFHHLSPECIKQVIELIRSRKTKPYIPRI